MDSDGARWTACPVAESFRGGAGRRDGARPGAANGRTVYDAVVFAVTALQRIDTTWADDAIATIVSLAEEITQLAIDEASVGPVKDEAALSHQRPTDTSQMSGELGDRPA